MSVLKFIEITGESPESWVAAAREAVETARRTVRQLRHLEVVRLTGRLEDDGSLLFQTTVKLAFRVEEPTGS